MAAKIGSTLQASMAEEMRKSSKDLSSQIVEELSHKFAKEFEALNTTKAPNDTAASLSEEEVKNAVASAMASQQQAPLPQTTNQLLPITGERDKSKTMAALKAAERFRIQHNVPSERMHSYMLPQLQGKAAIWYSVYESQPDKCPGISTLWNDPDPENGKRGLYYFLKKAFAPEPTMSKMYHKIRHSNIGQEKEDATEFFLKTRLILQEIQEVAPPPFCVGETPEAKRMTEQYIEANHIKLLWGGLKQCYIQYLIPVEDTLTTAEDILNRCVAYEELQGGAVDLRVTHAQPQKTTIAALQQQSNQRSQGSSGPCEYCGINNHSKPQCHIRRSQEKQGNYFDRHPRYPLKTAKERKKEGTYRQKKDGQQQDAPGQQGQQGRQTDQTSLVPYQGQTHQDTMSAIQHIPHWAMHHAFMQPNLGQAQGPAPFNLPALDRQ